jgi:hypothetical protein
MLFLLITMTITDTIHYLMPATIALSAAAGNVRHFWSMGKVAWFARGQ